MLQPGRGDCGHGQPRLHDDIPTWVRPGGPPGLLRATGYRVQVPALGLHGGPFQGACPNWGHGGVVWDGCFSGAPIYLHLLPIAFLKVQQLNSSITRMFYLLSSFPCKTGGRPGENCEGGVLL